MTEYASLDPKYDYEQITEDDIWTYGAVEAAGVIKLTPEIYEREILN